MRLRPFPAGRAGASGWAGFRMGVGFIRRDRRVLALVVLVAAFSVFGFPFLVLMPVVARNVLHTDARGYGVLMPAVGIGARLGALGLAAPGRPVPKCPALRAA